ncbi:DDE-type integrase/transposase/recombinase [Fervidobacterium thailandense]|uniref:DDE-type integrase/transposase/recombinase n=1 Tax=Fervidobacterium thailandense TaxID=1008305 RepID=UPI00355BE915
MYNSLKRGTPPPPHERRYTICQENSTFLKDPLVLTAIIPKSTPIQKHSVFQRLLPECFSIYCWIKTLSSAIKFSPIHFKVLCVDEKFEKLASKGKTDTVYVFLAVSLDNYLIANFGVSLNRDMLQAIKLIFPCQPKLVLSDGLTSYAQACEYLNVQHKTISSKTNQAVESRNSLLAMFTQVRRGFKKLSNVISYIKAFVVLHNIKRELRMQEPGDWVKIQRPLVEYLVNHFEELFAFG